MDENTLDGCDVCGQEHATEDCPILASDEEENEAPAISRARLTLPTTMEVLDHPDGSTSVITKETFKPKRRFGPYEAKRTTQKVEMDVGFILKVLIKDGGAVWLDTTEENSCNWLSLVRTADSGETQNLMAVQLGTDIYYITTKLIEPGTELRVWYAPHYARKLGRSLEPDGKTQTLLGHSLVLSAPEVVMFVEGPGNETNTDQVNLLNSDRQNITENLESLGLNWSTIQNLLNQSNNQEGEMNTDETEPPSLPAAPLPKLATPRGALVKHRENDQGPRVCRKCNATFESLQELAQHVKIHLRASESKAPKKRGRGRPRKRKSTSPEAKRIKVEAPNVAEAEGEKEGEGESEETQQSVSNIRIVDVSASMDRSVLEGDNANLSTVISIKSTDNTLTDQPENTEGIIATGNISDAQNNTEIVLFVSDEFGTRVDGQFLAQAQEENAAEEESAEETNDGVEENDPDYVPDRNLSKNENKISENREEDVVQTQPKVHSSPKKNIVPTRRGRRGQITKNCTLIFDDNKKVMYKCNHCPLCFSKLEMFSRHLEECHKTSLICTQCSQQFDSVPELSSHICTDNIYNPETKDTIPVSKTQDPSPETAASLPIETINITSEIQAIEDVDGKKHKCRICEKSFEKLKYLKRHLRGHTNMFYCQKCAKSFVRKETLQNHTCDQDTAKGIIDEENPFVCEFCGVSFAKQKYLFRHMAAHTGEFHCKTCNREFSRKESLLQHIKKFHPEEMEQAEGKLFPCEQCNRVFSRQVTLENHMKLHQGTHTCPTCGRSFASAFSLEKHTCGFVFKTDSGFTCKACDKTFNTEAAALRHQTLHSGEFTCQICNCPFSRKELLNQHLLVCTALMQSETNGEIVCNVCEKNFPDAASFRLHYQDHTHPYKCDRCDQKFLRFTNLRKHNCKEPIVEKSAECQICKKKFRHERFLQRHMVLHNTPKYQCLQCNRKFGRIDFFNDHMCVNETGERVRIQRNTKKSDLIPSSDAQAICPTCGKSYSSVSNLNKHMKTHGEKKEVCDVCNKTFHLKIALREHMESVHTDVFKHQCQYCGKFLKCRNSIFAHVRQFHSDITIMYECEQCGKQFRQKGNLKKHILTHSAKKTFKCKDCTKKFKFPDQLKRHELWHTHGERYQCEFCQKKFVMPFELRKHQQMYHSGIMYVCEYCLTECRHSHTMKRHLQRRHSNELAWQANPVQYIKGLIPQHRLKINNPELQQQIDSQQQLIQEGVIEQTVQHETVETTVETQDGNLLAAQLQAQIQDPNAPLSDQPIIVAEVAGLAGGDQAGMQTVIIRTTGDQFDNDIMSQEVAAALRSLTKQGTLDESTFAIIQNVSTEGTEEVAQLELQEHPVVTTDDKSYVVVPMTANNTEDTISVFNTDIVQDQIYTETS